MADNANEIKSADTAEKAYVAAAEAKTMAPGAPGAPPAVKASSPAPAKPTAGIPAAKTVAPVPSPKAAEPALKPVAVPAPVVKAGKPALRTVAVPKTVRAPKAGKPKAGKQVPKPAPKAAKASRKVAASKKVAAPKVHVVSKPTYAPKPTPIAELKEKIMATSKATAPDYTKLAQDIQGKAKEAYAKGSALASEAVELTKGNVEAIVASGKILASGTQALGKEYVTETKTAFDTMTADLKELAAIKSPTELFQLQGKIARRNFDHAVAFSSKSSESLLKLANEVFAPISNRVSLAVDKVSKVA